MFREPLELLASLMRAWRGPSSDPYAGVPEPRRHGPAGPRAAVAVTEPQPDRTVDATGGPGRSPR